MLAVHASEFNLFLDQVVRAIRTDGGNHTIECVEPLGGFLGIVVLCVGNLFQNFVGYSGHARLLGGGNAL